MAHRKWKEIKQQPGTAGPGNMLGCCLLSFNFLWAIHPIRPVLAEIGTAAVMPKTGFPITATTTERDVVGVTCDSHEHRMGPIGRKGFVSYGYLNWHQEIQNRVLNTYKMQS